MNATIMIEGFVGNDAKFATTHSNKAIASTTICHSEQYTDSAGTEQKRSDWYKLEFWGHQAELARQIRKGDLLIVCGEVSVDKYIDKDGVAKTAPKITARTWGYIPKMQESKPTEKGVEISRAQTATEATGSTKAYLDKIAAKANAAPAQTQMEDNPDDLPF